MTVLNGVGLAISTYRSNPLVLARLREAFGGPLGFDRVLVVDSEGDGTIPHHIDDSGYDAIYRDFPTNLGAAGNHAKRLELASHEGLEWCYFLNDDGCLEFDNVRAMLETAAAGERVGAVYPLIFNGTRSKPWEDGRITLRPVTGRLTSSRPADSNRIDVAWGSSNGALYSLAPYRAGLRIWTDVWHTYEDFGYGALLHDNGWRQLVCRQAVLKNAYEYKQRFFFGRKYTIIDKPVWYFYYNIRNLILITYHRRFSPSWIAGLVKKIGRDVAVIVLLQDKRATRLGLFGLGIVHGLLRKGGKWKLP